ncbi:MAG: hypothetical protein P8X87_07990, partial [Candidatus Bathyarchaeota archaeon]
MGFIGFTKYASAPKFKALRWGTTDIQAINMTIHDYKFEFDLGRVNFCPFLTEPNPEATFAIPEFPSWTPLLVALVAVLFVAVVYSNRL